MRTRFLWLVVVMGLLGAALAPQASGQTLPAPNPDRINAIKAKLAEISARYGKLSANQRMLLDGEKRLGVSPQVIDRLAAIAASGQTVTRKQFTDIMADAQKAAGLASVNDPSTDLDFSAYDGVTQSETHTAMCGNQVVVGFNDSGSILQTIFFGTGGLSFSGAAVSSDGGKTFHDIGAMNPGADFSNFVSGDPLITCTDSSHFFYTQLFETGSGSAIGISSSSDGGNTWGDPQATVLKDGFTHFLDKPWTAIDPSNTQRVYITYTDFDASGTSPGCGPQSRTAIELVTSNDGGQHFSSPVIIDEQCGDNVGVQISHVAFNSHSVAYIAWERFNPTNVEVRITHLSPGGSPAPSLAVDQKVFGGDIMLVNGGSFFFTLELEEDLAGQFRNFAGLDLAVDHSGGPSDGTVYVTWDDGRNKSTPDLAGFSLQGNPDQPAVLIPFSPLILTAGTYAYTDILLSRSKDGVHFGPTIQVNSDHQPKVGGGHDHFQPAIAVDATGKAAICWYDRRNDPKNFAIERFCAESKNGNEWNNFRVPIAPFAPLHRTDFGFFPLGVNPAYMGDYDGLTTDFTGKNKGFIGAFEWMSSGMNPDVKAFKFE